MNWRDNKRILSNFIEENHWTLKISKNPEQTLADSGTETIYLYVLPNKRTTTCYLLHEIGHMLIYNDPTYYNTKFKALQEARDKSYYGSRRYAIGRLHEEIEAWEIGREVMHELEIDIAPKFFERTKNDALKTYLEWTYNIFTTKPSNKKKTKLPKEPTPE